jgi:hypothetical protein
MSAHRLSLRIEEPTGVRRVKWPVRRGVPFPKGTLDSADRVRLLEPQGGECDCEVREMARWEDGSVKWILLDFQVGLDPQETAVYELEYGKDVERAPVVSPLQVEESEEKIRISTGPLELTVKRNGFDLLEQVRLDGRKMLSEGGQRLWLVAGDGTRYELSGGTVEEVVVEEWNAQLAVIRARGTHGTGEGRGFFDYLVRIYAWANLPWVQIEYTFINTEDDEYTEVREIVLETGLALEENQVGLCGSGRKLYQSEEPFSFYHESLLENFGVFSGSSVYRQDGTRVEGVGIYEQQLARGWMDVSDAGRGVCIGMRDFVLLYPKEASWEKDRIAFSIWPDRAQPLRLHQGMARTHAFLLQFHEGGGKQARINELATAWEEPLLPENGEWYLQSEAFGLVMPFRPDKYPSLERKMRDQIVQIRNSRSLGMIDYGDFINPGTGSQGGFSTNNEHDRLHGLLLHHLRSGMRIPWTVADSIAWHVADVDVVHHTTRSSMELGGQRIHGHGHVQYDAEGYPAVSTVPSHMWTEGLLEYHYLTGHPHFREIALGIGECFLKMVEVGWCKPPYHSNWHSARDSGWPLIGMTAVYEATRDERYRQAMRLIFEAVREAQHDNGGWSMELFFNVGFSPLHLGICLAGLARYHEACDDEEALAVFNKGIDYLAGDEMRFADGAWMYVTTPEYQGTYYSDTPVEPFGYAYKLTQDKQVIEQVLRGWCASLDLRASLRFLWAADASGLLQDQ